MSQLHENKPVESKVTEWLSQMGWEYHSAEDLKQYKRLQTNAVIAKYESLNLDIDEPLCHHPRIMSYGHYEAHGKVPNLASLSLPRL